MWKDFLDKGKCLLGFHEGEWRFRSAASCAQVQVCTRCTVETERIEHRWNEWAYAAENECNLTRGCARCAQTETRVEHAWSEPVYKYDGTCERLAECRRCGEEENRDTQHAFTAWQYRSEEDCTQVEACSRCGQPGQTTRFRHDWTPPIDSAFYESQVRVCRHCGEMVVSAPGADASSAPSMQAIQQAVDRLIAAKSADDIRWTLNDAHGVLFSPGAEKYFQFAFEQYAIDAAVTEQVRAAHRIVTRCRGAGIEAGLQELFGAPPLPPSSATSDSATTRPSSPGGRDSRLVGHWRHTEARSGSGFSMVIDTNCVIDADGEFAWWSRSESTMGGSRSEPESGTWQTQNGELVLRFADGAVMTRAYAADNSGMLWPGDGRYRIWQRV